MAIKAKFFNGVEYDAADVNEQFQYFYTNGIVSNTGSIGNSFAVSRKAGLILAIASGIYCINGGVCEIDGNGAEITLDAADENLPRIDTIAIEYNLSTDVHTIRIVAVKGTPASTPEAPELQNTSTVYQEPLADVLIPAGATEAGSITDRRQLIAYQRLSPAEFIDHENNHSNPHGVTAAQAGAMPTTGGTFTGDVNISSGKQIMIGGKEAGTDNYLRWAGYSGTNWWGFHRYIDPDTGNTIFGHVINTVSGTTQIWTCPSNTKTVTFTNAIVNGSDRRLKNNIADMENAKPLIMGLKAKQFRMNCDDSGKLNYGFIAQDVDAILGEIGIENSGLVVDSGNIDNIENALGLSYTQLIAPMVSVIQEQEQRIAALEERLDRLEQSL